MERSIATLLLALGVAPATTGAQAAPDWKARIRADHAKVVDGEYRYRTVQRCVKEGSDETVEIRSSAQAPTSAVSRDFFLWFVGATEASFTDGIQPGAGSGQVRCKNASELDGVPDLELRIVMNELGFRLDVLYPGGRTDSETRAWADVL